MKKKLILDILPEYDFSGGIRGKYAKKFAEGTNIIVLAPDVHKNFPTSSSVNETLRALSKIVKNNRKKITA
jgi:urate oxidase